MQTEVFMSEVIDLSRRIEEKKIDDFELRILLNKLNDIVEILSPYAEIVSVSGLLEQAEVVRAQIETQNLI